ncbi:MAG: TIGR00300 family protein, partial [Nitrosopumilales archaeon CG_4_9_14_0_2_um_filter_34_16]
MTKFAQEIEVQGHLIDSSILTKIFDKIMDLQGEFQVQEIKIGEKKGDTSFARLLITGKNQKQLDEILETVYRLGAVSKIQKEITLKKSPKNCVMPDNFYSTTNNHTHVFHKGRWIPVENMMMDKCIVVKSGRAFCVPVRDVKKDDLIIVGESGVKITPPERPREGVNVFEFMGSSSSSERPTQHIAKKVADDIYNTKKKGGKIVIVGGPAIVHTGADDAVSELIRSGYIDGVLAGNAL